MSSRHEINVQVFHQLNLKRLKYMYFQIRKTRNWRVLLGPNRGVYMGPKFYACVAMSHDKKCLSHDKNVKTLSVAR